MIAKLKLAAVSAFASKYLVPLGVALGAGVYDIPDSGHVNWRAVGLVAAKAGLAALGITTTATADFVHKAVGAVTRNP